MYERETIFVVLFLCLKTCAHEIDCAMAHFDGSTTNSAHKVYCGSGYHPCGSADEGCCSDVVALPIELTLVILGPIATAISALLTIFVLKVVISSALSKEVDTTHINPTVLQ